MLRRLPALRFLATSLFLVIGPGIASAPDGGTLRSASSRETLLETARDLSNAIVAVDVARVLKHISRSGMVCTDTEIPYSDVAKALRNKHSSTFLALFDGPAFEQRCNRNGSYGARFVSDREFLTAADLKFEAEIGTDADGRLYGSVRVSSPSHDAYPLDWQFSHEGSRWMLVGGFIFGCSCG
jgi:hypothetical protein